jgi:hypothetical protein
MSIKQLAIEMKIGFYHSLTCALVAFKSFHINTVSLLISLQNKKQKQKFD